MSTELWSDMAPDLWPAFWTTIKLTFWSALGSMILGTILTAMRVSPVGILRTIATFYINTTRNTPLTLIVLFASLGLYVNLNVTLAPQGPTFTTENNFRLAVLAFILYTSSFVAESLRAGINTVPFGQAEAARSLGLSFMQNFRYIIFPQALRGAIVPLGNTLIALTKNTTIASVIGVAEASLLMKTSVENHADQVFVIFGIIALGFIILTLPTGLIFGAAGKRLAVKR
ncbi:glutamate ABC transporter permease [Corynebacterium falsenii DSM 44353]|uniref:Amino acid ABC transporter permease n=1 Tax=Corynebacterium falsenii TaxID=108486 RepID=A0A418Q8F5_9CORY|nr:amino acid ABC transporter permease [Corynebacterium falsenii]AHI03260.1 glutamate ABC transporter permease [Corynebacterium falsenii DSM 44353]MDC7103416.1 amino acid ABC transporter permease [Corynebacterium falsenii]RIX35771.1 amino acid ABC transporter permease [Corynebacterium falsenii]UBI03954.1 amino acid ABC transporter permease [Corynebacterium falsenii]UBI06034.1 amino acid ABC transporter permease [Corynebacterium falsenii]